VSNTSHLLFKEQRGALALKALALAHTLLIPPIGVKLAFFFKHDLPRIYFSR
jgi:hypothetical protein